MWAQLIKMRAKPGREQDLKAMHERIQGLDEPDSWPASYVEGFPVSVENAMAGSRTKRTYRLVTLTGVGLSLAVLGALTGCSGGSDEPVASAPTPTTSEMDSAPEDWQDDPDPAAQKADMEGNAIAFAQGYAFEISNQAGGEEATVRMQNTALTTAANNIEGNYYEVEVQNLSGAGKATVAISQDGLCATFTVPNSNDGSMSDLSYAAAPATATAGEGNEAPTCT